LSNQIANETVENALIFGPEIQPVKGDVKVSVRIWRGSGRRRLSVKGSRIANERLNEQAHVVGKTHRVGVGHPVNENHNATLGNRRLLPYVVEAPHDRIEPPSFIERELTHELHLLCATAGTKMLDPSATPHRAPPYSAHQLRESPGLLAPDKI
jgi:hypothetical protein